MSRFQGVVYRLTDLLVKCLLCRISSDNRIVFPFIVSTSSLNDFHSMRATSSPVGRVMIVTLSFHLKSVCTWVRLNDINWFNKSQSGQLTVLLTTYAMLPSSYVSEVFAGESRDKTSL